MNCIYCNNEFTPKNKTQKFCSSKCRIDYNNSFKLANKPERIEHCKECGKEFIVPSANQNKQFCSNKCYRAFYNKIYNKKSSDNIKQKWLESDKRFGICPICGETFERDSNHPDMVYCSRSCYDKQRRLDGKYKGKDERYLSKIRYGGNREQIFERDEHKCKLCGSNKNLDIHHIDFSGESEVPNNETNNLITLCRSCHMKVHKGKANISSLIKR